MKCTLNNPSPHANRRGFTVIEVVLAVSAFMLLAAVLLSILRIIDRTRAAGANLSNATTVSNMLEQRLRADFDRMTRDGFLVIRNRLSPAVPLANGLGASQRRIDEIMFFTAGQSGTVRAALDAGRNAQGQAAAVYIGHGLSRGPGTAADPNFAKIDDTNSQAPAFGADGPSRYAKDWILARVPLTLASPTNPAVAVTTGGALTVAPRYLDSPIQIALQPAAKSLFRTINLTPSGLGQVVNGFRGDALIPVIASGTVDVVSQDLSTIRQIMLGGYLGYRLSDPLPENAVGTGGGTAIGNGVFPISPLTPQLSDIERGMNRLMLDALPTDSAVAGNKRIRVELQAPLPDSVLLAANPQISRDDATMLTTTSLLPGVSEFIVEWSFGLTYGPSSANGPAIADPSKIGSTIWHGMRRPGDPETQIAGDPLGSVSPFIGGYPINLYGDVGARVAARSLGQPQSQQSTDFIERLIVDPTAVGGQSVEKMTLSGLMLVTARTSEPATDGRLCIMYPRTGMLPGLHEMSQQRVHGDSGLAAADPVDSFFGYYDTRYRPLVSRDQRNANYPAQLAIDRNNDDLLNDNDGDDGDKTILVRDVNGNGRYDPLDGDRLAVPDTLPAAWPAQIRVTIRYAGVGVPLGSEQTFVYVFTTPGVFPSGAN